MLVDMDQFPVSRIEDGDELPADKTALVIVDMLNRFCDPDWWLWVEDPLLPGRPGDEARREYFTGELAAIIPNTKTVLESFRSAGATVVHVTTGRWRNDGREMVGYMHDRDYDLVDSPAMSVIAPLAPRPGEILIRKPASSSFTGTGLDYLLRNAGIEQVVLCGQYGNGCVLYTLIQSREYGYRNTWIEDAVLYQSQAFKDVMPPIIGARWAKLAGAGQVCAIMQGRPVETTT